MQFSSVIQNHVRKLSKVIRHTLGGSRFITLVKSLYISLSSDVFLPVSPSVRCFNGRGCKTQQHLSYIFWSVGFGIYQMQTNKWMHGNVKKVKWSMRIHIQSLAHAKLIWPQVSKCNWQKVRTKCMLKMLNKLIMLVVGVHTRPQVIRN